jgi:hypothetical protein
MSSVVTICNLALGNLGKDSISSINEASAEARACKQFYDIVVDTAIQSYPWRWAGKTLSLAEVSNSKPNRWLYAYQRPDDCIKLLRIVDEGMADYMPYGDGIKAGGHDYQIEGRTIFCDISPAYLQYTARQSDPALFPPAFVDALGMALAARIAMPITRDLRIRADAVSLARQGMAAAQEYDASEVREVSDHPSDRIEAMSPQYAATRSISG